MTRSLVKKNARTLPETVHENGIGTAILLRKIQARGSRIGESNVLLQNRCTEKEIAARTFDQSSGYATAASAGPRPNPIHTHSCITRLVIQATIRIVTKSELDMVNDQDTMNREISCSIEKHVHLTFGFVERESRIWNAAIRRITRTTIRVFAKLGVHPLAHFLDQLLTKALVLAYVLVVETAFVDESVLEFLNAGEYHIQAQSTIEPWRRHKLPMITLVNSGVLAVNRRINHAADGAYLRTDSLLAAI